MEAATRWIGWELAGQAAATAAAGGQGTAGGLLLSGATAAAALATAAAVSVLVFLAALVRGCRETRDPDLRLACDAVSALGAAALSWTVPSLMPL